MKRKILSRIFYVAPDIDLKPLEDIFRVSIFKMLKDEGKIDDGTINKLMSWRHSSFSVHNGARVARDDEKGKEAVSHISSVIPLVFISTPPQIAFNILIFILPVAIYPNNSGFSLAITSSFSYSGYNFHKIIKFC